MNFLPSGNKSYASIHKWHPKHEELWHVGKYTPPEWNQLQTPCMKKSCYLSLYPSGLYHADLHYISISLMFVELNWKWNHTISEPKIARDHVSPFASFWWENWCSDKLSDLFKCNINKC